MEGKLINKKRRTAASSGHAQQRRLLSRLVEHGHVHGPECGLYAVALAQSKHVTCVTAPGHSALQHDHSWRARQPGSGWTR